MTSESPRSTTAEFIGTAGLVSIVVGSGIMGEQLSDDWAVVLLLNAVATVLGLAILIYLLAPISGAHLNPVVTAIAVRAGELSKSQARSYIGAQILGATTGAVVANVMYGYWPVSISHEPRWGVGQWLGEIIATAGLVVVIRVAVHRGHAALVPVAVAAWIGSAYLFTSSTSFANPAVTIGRIFSDSFAGIGPISALLFIAVQCAGAALGWKVAEALCASSVSATIGTTPGALPESTPASEAVTAKLDDSQEG